MGVEVDEIVLEIEDLESTFLALRSHQFVIDRELQLENHRDQIKKDIIWNTEIGLNQSTSDLARAERARKQIYETFADVFREYELLVTPGANTPAFDVNLRHPVVIDGQKLEHYMGASLLTGAVTLSASPALSLPCGFDKYQRPVGLQIVGRPRGEAAVLAAASLFEKSSKLSELVPIDPKLGEVPPLQ